MKCKKCGIEIAETAVFCKKCGTKIEKVINEELEIGVKKFEDLSLKLREISDEMIREYVSKMKCIEIENLNIEIKFKEEIQDLKDLLVMKDDELQELRKQISILEENLKEAKNRIEVFESGEKMDMKVEKDNQISEFCYNCGDVITDDMLYCGNCGVRLK